MAADRTRATLKLRNLLAEGTCPKVPDDYDAWVNDVIEAAFNLRGLSDA